MAYNDHRLSFLTLNVQGLRKFKTRRALFRYFKSSNLDVVALQETYLLNEDLEQIENEWDGTVHMSPATTKRSKGLLTLFSKSICKSKIKIILNEDRILSSQVDINNNTFIRTQLFGTAV